MIELPLIFIAGFLGSSHCIGMCGPFAMLLGGSAPTWQSSLARQATYSVGRVFTYSVFGVVAGFAGLRLSEASANLVNVPAVLAIAAGCFLVYQGLATAGLRIFRIGKPSTTVGKPSCLAGGLLSNFLKSPSRSDVFIAGLLTGFLPCGLVYGFVGIAASTRSIGMGLLTMVAFGLGTVPIMAATGIGARVLSQPARTQIVRVAAVCVVLAGFVSIARGVSFFGLENAQQATEACPLCP